MSLSQGFARITEDHEIVFLAFDHSDLQGVEVTSGAGKLVTVEDVPIKHPGGRQLTVLGSQNFAVTLVREVPRIRMMIDPVDDSLTFDFSLHI